MSHEKITFFYGKEIFLKELNEQSKTVSKKKSMFCLLSK